MTVNYAAKRRKALEAGQTFFVGRVCERHRELRGQRRAKSGDCPQCIRDRMARPEIRAKTKKRLKRRLEAIKAGTYSPRPYRKAAQKIAPAG
jgi:hypothetical protein